MKGIKIRRAVARYFVLLIGLGTCASVCAQSIPNQQCSLAVVSRLVGSGAAVCDGAVVQRMAAQGQAFEENQMGIASVLSIGPDYDQKKAVEWFQRAAQHGYAPVQVNLAVMYINGWGTQAVPTDPAIPRLFELIRLYAQLQRRIQELDKEMEVQARQRPQACRLLTHPDVGYPRQDSQPISLIGSRTVRS
jgi:hypothetical protein